MAEKIRTLHPAGKTGVNIDADKYQQIREAMVNTLDQHGEMGFKELAEILKKLLDGKFEGSVSWYMTTVKLDLEARGEILCQRKKGGQRIRRASSE